MHLLWGYSVGMALMGLFIAWMFLRLPPEEVEEATGPVGGTVLVLLVGMLFWPILLLLILQYEVEKRKKG